MSDTGNRFPPGWDEARVRDVIDYYESQTEDEAVAEDEAAFEKEGYTVMVIPTDLVPAVRALLSESTEHASAPAPAVADGP